MRKDTSWNKADGAKVVLIKRDSAGSSLSSPVMAVPAFPFVVKSVHTSHATHGKDVEHTHEYRFFYLLVFAVFLLVGCIRYVLALIAFFSSAGDRGKPIPHPFVEGRSMAKIYVPYIFQL